MLGIETCPIVAMMKDLQVAVKIKSLPDHCRQTVSQNRLAIPPRLTVSTLIPRTLPIPTACFRLIVDAVNEGDTLHFSGLLLLLHEPK